MFEWNIIVLKVNFYLFCFRGDTTLILGTCAGILTGGWLIVTLDIQDDYRVMNPMNNPISWPSINDLGKYLHFWKLIKCMPILF